MPNGDPNFDLEDLERYFSPLEDAVEAFAERHNLLLDKYYHDSSAWYLRFRHPRGGDATISVQRAGDSSVLVSTSLHIDDYQRLVRTVYWRDPRSVTRDGSAISKALRLELDDLLRPLSGSWSKKEVRFPRSRRVLSKARLEATRPIYPEPIVDD